MSGLKVPVEQLGGPVVSADLPNHDTGSEAYPQVSKNSPLRYFDIIGKVWEVKFIFKYNEEHTKKVYNIFQRKLNKNCYIYVALFFMVISIASIIIGSLNVHNCYEERYIPIFLIVAGAFGLLRSVIIVTPAVMYKIVKSKWEDCERNQAEQMEEDEEQNPPKKNALIFLIDLFLFAWIIAGSVWVYRAGAWHYGCDKTTYRFAFLTITIMYAFMALGLLFCCFMGTVSWQCTNSATYGRRGKCNQSSVNMVSDGNRKYLSKY